MTIDEQFEKFHADNPQVYKTLRRLALNAHALGRRKMGIGMLWEVMRWEFMFGHVVADDDYKLNNNFRSRYARKLMSEVPELSDMFETRFLPSQSAPDLT